ncbi:MAG: GAF and ANTAR domain-containing protein [Lapillicoccus sp.]
MNDVPGSAPLSDISRRLTETINVLGGADTVPTLQDIVTVAQAQVGSADAVSLSRLQHGRFTTPASTDELAREGDALQYSLGSGPCVDAVVDNAIYQPQDLSQDPRWPEYGRRASEELGIYSILAFRLHTGRDDVIDGLNFYARAVDAFTQEDTLNGLVVATQAALAISNENVRHLRLALESNREIGAASGILMATHKVTFDQAFGLLRVASQNTNRPVRVIAAEVVRTGALDIPAVRTADIEETAPG